MAKSQTAAKTATKSKAPAPTKAQIAKAAKIGLAAEPPVITTLTKPGEITDDQRKAERRANVDAMAFSVQQISAPQAPVQTPQPALDKYQAELKVLQEKFGIKAAEPKVAANPRASRVKLNDVTRPADGTVTGKIWALADELSKASGTVATIAAIKGHVTMAGVNDHTIKTQYARWRAFNGVKGRLPKINSVHQVQGEYEGIPNLQVPAAAVVKAEVEAAQNPTDET